MAILVGPSIGTAKSRVFFAVDRLETKIWGTRDDLPRTRPMQADESEESDAEEEERDSESEISEFDSENEGADDNGPDDSDSESTSDQAEEESCTSTPSSPTSRPPTPPRPKHLSPNSHSTSTPHPAESSEVLEEHILEQQRIRAAGHQLSRVLATADAEGRGMQCELGLCFLLPFTFRSDIRIPLTSSYYSPNPNAHPPPCSATLQSPRLDASVQYDSVNGTSTE